MLMLVTGCAAGQQNIRSTITPDAIAAATEPLLFVEVPETGQQTIMSLKGRNGNVETWSSADGLSISLDDGVLVATRGFGHDLMGADISGTLNALRGGPQNYERFASYLSANNTAMVESFTCEIIAAPTTLIQSFGRVVYGSLWTETCMQLGIVIVSDYFVDSQNVWRTSQWFSPQRSPLTIERLNY
jgi:hypothetical protein